MFCAGNSCLAPRLSRDRFFRAIIMIFVLIKLKKPRNYRLRSLRNSTEITLLATTNNIGRAHKSKVEKFENEGRPR